MAGEGKRYQAGLCGTLIVDAGQAAYSSLPCDPPSYTST